MSEALGRATAPPLMVYHPGIMGVFDLPTYFYVCLAAAALFDVWRMQFASDWTIKNIIVVNAFFIPGYLIIVVVAVSPGLALMFQSQTLLAALFGIVILLAAVFVWALSTGLSILFAATQFVFLVLAAVHAFLGGQEVAFLMFAVPVIGFFFPMFDDFRFFVELGSGIVYGALLIIQGAVWLWSQR